MPRKAPFLFPPMIPSSISCPKAPPPQTPSEGATIIQVRPYPSSWPCPCAPEVPPSGAPSGPQALTEPPSPFSVSTVCCLTNSSSRKGEFIEEKDQSFCWKMLFPVLVPCFLILHFHMQDCHILGIPVQKMKSPQAQGTFPCPISYLAKQGKARCSNTSPSPPQVLPRTQGRGK